MKYWKIIVALIIILSGCQQKNNKNTNNTIFFFFPWSTNLTHYFENNIINFKNDISPKDLNNNRVVVFIAKSESTAFFYEIKNHKGRIIHDTIAQFNDYNYKYTSVDGLSELLTLAKGSNPTLQFSMIIGCHGDAWIPAKDMKRSFGGASKESRIDINTLKNALKKSNITAEYILFDDCYMSSIEVAYELRNSCNFLIASPAEIMAAGMPFKNIAQDLLNTPNYENICNDFYNYYANQTSAPYGAIAIINCKELENLAKLVKQINNTYSLNNNLTTKIQFYDGYTPHIFYDFGHYMSILCPDNKLLQEFNAQLNLCIPYKATTTNIYAYSFGTIKIEHFSGISTSAPSSNPKCISYKETEWYKNTCK